MTKNSNNPSSPFSPFFRSLFFPTLVLIIGMFLSIWDHLQFQKETNDNIQVKLDQRIEYIRDGVAEKFNLYKYGLKGLRGAMVSAGVQDFDYLKMQNYINSREHEIEFPGARGFGVLKKIPQAEIKQFVADAARERPDKHFQLKQLTQHNDDVFILQYIEPEITNKQAIGLDIASEPTRHKAAIKSALNNSPTLTAPIILVEEDQSKRQGFLLLLPVYSQHKIPEIPEQRMQVLYGWVSAVLSIDEVLTSFSGLSKDVNLKIYDVTEQNVSEFFSFGKNISEVTHQSETTIELLGRHWMFELLVDDSYIETLNNSEFNESFFAIIIITLSIVLIIYIVQLVFQRRRLVIDKGIEQENILKLANQNLERKVNERTLEITRLSSLQKSILEAASYAIIATTNEGMIMAFNPAAEKLLGYKASDVIGKITPAQFHIEQEVVIRALELTEELGQEIKPSFDVFTIRASLGLPELNRWTYRTKSGDEIPVNLSITALTDGNNQQIGFLGIAYDLTEQIKQQTALAKAKEIAEKANRSKSEFLANMSHEIRTPMNGLFGTLQLLENKALDEEGKNLLSKAIYSTKSLTTIINDILDFSKIEAGKFALEIIPFSLTELIDNLATGLEIEANNKKINLEIINNVEDDYWFGDPTRISQILINILSNAIKFTTEGIVSLEVMQDKETEGVVFTVIDTGIGISDEALQRLFDRFEQADNSTTRKFGGTGLGLAISDSLVKLMNGKIGVESTLGLGSKFTIHIPLTHANESQINSPNVVIEALNLQDKTILVAEDNPINQLVVVTMLKQTNARVDVVDNGQKAIDYCLENRPDLILMDIQMPEVDGVEACTEIKSKNKVQKVVALTANVFTEERIQYELLFDGYLAKPIEKQALYKMLSTLLT
ncbi:CHASE domain-containing protein [Psychrosphaera sp. F3M07]|uniref:CHASE domain-containing protein n=1 Tax=Psychrosphaera sp. F3M07 TaxID=2841560 RepID=UPI001C087B3E|nr:CHASE domain-containing protein [Psychrosphaera sp. F3M07]MBU2918022.1 CHASE domain-containing protein [Psychrosphaera sp. F3M07]